MIALKFEICKSWPASDQRTNPKKETTGKIQYLAVTRRALRGGDYTAQQAI